MTTELEKQFFETFNIPKQFKLPVENFKYSYKNYKEAYKSNRACNNWEHQETIDELKKGKYEYPIITDTHYLELMCIFSDYIDTTKKDIQELKNYILEEFIISKAGFSDKELIKIQALFKGE